MKQSYIILHVILAAFCGLVLWLPTTYNFLAWNLFLALVPFEISLFLAYLPKRSWRWLLSLLWLVFYPNTMYMLTDFMHLYSLETIGNARMNYAVLSMGILLGVLLGLRSVNLVYHALFGQTCWWRQFSFYTFVSFLSAYGMYLGRFLRLNSWNVVTDLHGTWSSLGQTLSWHSVEFVTVFGCLQLGLMLFNHALRNCHPQDEIRYNNL